MEKAILKTLIYSNIFDYPLKAYEVHKWLIVQKASLRDVEKGLQRLYKKNKVSRKDGYYFLFGRVKIVASRIKREKQSRKFFWKTKYLTWFLKLIPWVQLVGISGGLAMENAEKSDDIDLFIILSKGRLWISRLLVTFFLNAMGIRRKVNMTINQVSGKLCTNLLVEEDRLEQENKDLYTAHEVLQMKVLWQKEGIYYKYLSDNAWAFNFLPNWVGNSKNELRIMNHESRNRNKNHNSLFMFHDSIFDSLENLAKWFQLWYMKKPKGMERIQDGALYFHPNDISAQILHEYKARVNSL